MPSLMKVIGLADGPPFKGDYWLESFDVDAAPERHESYVETDGSVVINGAFGGTIRLTPDRAKARRFASLGDAIQAWNTSSTRRPKRPDGCPNKPLTALTVEVERVSAQESS